MTKDQPLKTKIMATLAYFDLFSFPLTAWEIHRQLICDKPVGLAECLAELAELHQAGTINLVESFYCLPDRENLIEGRKSAYLISGQKINKNRFLIRLINAMPFIDSIYVCNNVSYFNAQENSDLDLAIGCATGHIWTARFLAAGLMAILGQRPTKKTQKNRICLSFFFTEPTDFQPILYQNDIHFACWFNQFLPICADQTDKRLYAINSYWHKKFFANAYRQDGNDPRRHSSVAKKLLKKISPKNISARIEQFLKAFQLKIMPTELREKIGHGTDVYCDDSILKFHSHDTRLAIREQWTNKLKQYAQVETND